MPESFVVPRYEPETWAFPISSFPLSKMLSECCAWERDKTYRVFGELHKGAFCMSRKNKFSSELKKKVVRMCKSGQVSQAEAARRCGVSESTIKRWLSRERSESCAGLESEATNRVYPSELKLQAVTAYLTGKYSQQEICEKSKIKSTRQLHASLHHGLSELEHGTHTALYAARQGTACVCRHQI